MSLMLIYVIPILYLMLIETKDIYTIKYIIFLGCFGIIALYNIYEIGYIQNDTETIKTESNPGIRLLEENYVYYESHKRYIYCWRLFLSIVFSVSFFFLLELKSFVFFELSLIVILLLYQCYNKIRNRSLMLTYFFLISIRYISPLMMIYEHISYQTILCVLMINPVIKTISFKATKPTIEVKHNLFFRKYILRFNPQRLTGYRAIAYIIELMIVFILYFNGIFSIKYVFPILYMFLYRFFIWLAVKFKVMKYTPG
jgi:hypothetical protein